MSRNLPAMFGNVRIRLASSRHSVSQGAAHKTAHEKIKKSTVRGSFLSPRLFYFFAHGFCIAPWLTERLEEATIHLAFGPILENLRKSLESDWKSMENHYKCYVLWRFYIIKRKLHGHLKIRNLSSRVEKCFKSLLHSLVKHFHTLGHVISSIFLAQILGL